jgi:hypothetical protein
VVPAQGEVQAKRSRGLPFVSWVDANNRTPEDEDTGDAEHEAEGGCGADRRVCPVEAVSAYLDHDRP